MLEVEDKNKRLSCQYKWYYICSHLVFTLLDIIYCIILNQSVPPSLDIIYCIMLDAKVGI